MSRTLHRPNIDATDGHVGVIESRGSRCARFAFDSRDGNMRVPPIVLSESARLEPLGPVVVQRYELIGSL